MKGRLIVWSLVVSAVMLLLVWGTAQATDFKASEEQGLDRGVDQVTGVPGNGGTTPSLDSIPPDGVLLIPESLDDVVGMYDPTDGTFLGNLINGSGFLTTPINAIKGPDDNIYLSDQVADAVFVYDTDGAYQYTYADGSDGLNNIRGIDFRNDTLFVTSGDDYVARFAGQHNRIADFIVDGSDPFDIMFLSDGQSLLCNIQGTSDNLRLYDVDGSLISQVFSVDFPEQVQFDELEPGGYLNGSFSDDVITDFDLDGSIYQTTPLSYCRGVFRLGNGNILATNSSGVFELEPGSGNVIQQENTGSARFIELYKPAVTGVDSDSRLPDEFRVGQNFPNPFNARTSIAFTISQNSEVNVEIYNLLGQKVATPFAGQLDAGNHSVTWDAADLASGVYYYKVSAGDYSNIKMMTLLK